jgi:CBS domain-containing protein
LEGEKDMKTVGQLLRTKGCDVWSVPPEASVLDALKLMAEKNIGAVVVLEGDRLIGIFSERDYARKIILEGKTSRETVVKDIMTPEPACVHADMTMEECMVVMTDKRIRHLPVIEGERLVGLISIGDVVKAVISDQEFLIEQLENYINRAR